MDDKRRREIEEEERYRAEVRAKFEREDAQESVVSPAAPDKSKRKRGGCLRNIGVIILVMIGLAVLGSLLPESETSPSREAASPPKASDKTITFTSDPPSANIYIDDQEEPTDTTPAPIELSPGKHTYRVAFDNLDERSDRFRPYTGTITVIDDDGVSIWLDRFPPEEVETRKTIRLVEERVKANSSGEAVRPDGEKIDFTMASVLCKDHIKGLLKSPRSAKFAGVFSGDYREPTQTGNGWTQIVTVDAENSFGAMLRSQWRCVIDATADTITASEL